MLESLKSPPPQLRSIKKKKLLVTHCLVDLSEEDFSLVHVSSNQKLLCSSHISTFRAVLEIFLVIFGYIWGLIAFLKELVKFIIERGNFEELVLF